MGRADCFHFVAFWAKENTILFQLLSKSDIAVCLILYLLLTSCSKSKINYRKSCIKFPLFLEYSFFKKTFYQGNSYGWHFQSKDFFFAFVLIVDELTFRTSYHLGWPWGNFPAKRLRKKLQAPKICMRRIF